MARKLRILVPVLCAAIFSVADSALALNPQPLPPGLRLGATHGERVLPKPLFADGSVHFRR
jgi:hypothetical protein